MTTHPQQVERARHIRTIETVEDDLREGGRATPPISSADRDALIQRRKDAIRAYFALLPVVVLSRCPECDAPLKGTIDQWGFDGPWWQESRAGSKPPLQACPHFRVLTGAVVLGPKAPVGGGVEAHLGGDAPFVIPKVLERPTMCAVIQRLPMHDGHAAFPIAYFSSQPPPSPALANPWTMSSCNFKLSDGRSGFAYKTDPWDFDLAPWLAADRVRWIDPGKPDAALSAEHHAKFPFVFPAGPHHRLVLTGKHLGKLPPPNNEVVNPFGD